MSAVSKPDISVHDLTDLRNRLDSLKRQLEGALTDEDRMRNQWGQLNANLSMGDFADNWTGNRYDLEQKMKDFIEQIEDREEAWDAADAELKKGLETKP